MSINPDQQQIIKGAWKNAKRIVVKVGSSLVTKGGQGVDEATIQDWCRQIFDIHPYCSIVWVSSGAVAEGMYRLGRKTRPQSYHLQATAAVGQMWLTHIYASHLNALGLQTAQVLLTNADLADRERYLNARNTLLTLLQEKVIPIINENDTVVNESNKFGDNDTLAAMLVNLLEADMLLILTDQLGLYDADPRQNDSAKLLPFVFAGDSHLEKIAGGTGSSFSKGGMLSKILAAKRAANSGASTVIAYGKTENILPRLKTEGESIGTYLNANTPIQQARKRWMLDQIQVRGSVVVDDGAAEHLLHKGKSLLPVGMIEVLGEFTRGEVISILDAQKRPIAHGLANYNSSQARLLCRQASGKIHTILGGSVSDLEMVHRNNLLLLL
ncbi:MAG: glutamate 5-kinase [Gammaproteobacteria bacterium]|nr:glutamate 5-kinase [Gammaproteobacteria bacterium]